MSEIRRDFLLERYSIISEKRGQRPHHFNEKTSEKKKETCFFCPGNEKLTPPTIDKFPKSGPWEIRVFRNKFPALKPPLGDHEIIVETNKHGKQLEDLKPEEICDAFEMYDKRRLELEKTYKYISVFKNSGRPAGASLPHSHAQILATPVVPSIIARESEAAKAYYDKWHRCAWCDYIKDIDKKRVAGENEVAIAITANAPRYSYEVWVMPKRHVGTFSDLNRQEALLFCELMKKVLKKASELRPAYNFGSHHSQRGMHKFYHFHIELLPRVAQHAGFELCEGSYIIDTSPETAARFYRA